MDQQIISRYLGQPSELPAAVRSRIEESFGGEPVQLYGLADLDHSLQLKESWLALGPRHVALARPDAKGSWNVRAVERSLLLERSRNAGGGGGGGGGGTGR